MELRSNGGPAFAPAKPSAQNKPHNSTPTWPQAGSGENVPQRPAAVAQQQAPQPPDEPGFTLVQHRKGRRPLKNPPAIQTAESAGNSSLINSGLPNPQAPLLTTEHVMDMLGSPREADEGLPMS